MNRIKKLLSSKLFYISISSIALLGIITLLIFNFVIMPAYTNYNEGVTVPDVTKLAFSEASEILDSYGFRYEVADRRANTAYPADFIIDQTPSPLRIVKPNRKIYLTLNTATAPQAVVPDLKNMSLRNAEVQLENYGLKVGTRSYESSRFRNTILRQSIAPGDTVPRGTVINLTVSDGLGNRIVTVPEIDGLRLSEAQQVITRAGLRVGEIRFEPNDETVPNTVLSFEPDEEELTEGTVLTLVVSERFDAREESETGAIVDTTSAGQNNNNNEPPPDEL